nr:hypothetical protein [Tanacetum cinerariifolium]
KPILQPPRNQSVVRQPTAFKSERPRISKPWFASQVDANNDLSKPVSTHNFPKEREVASVKPHHVIASSNFRNSSMNLPRFSSNDMVHNHYLAEAKKKTQESSMNSEPSVMPSARSQSTSNGSKPKPRINNQQSRNWPGSKTSYVMTKSVPSNKTTNRFKPVEQTSFAKKPERRIPKGHRFSIKKTFVVHEKTITPRSCLRWKPTGKIFKTIGIRWVPTGKIFTSSTTYVDSESTNGSDEDIFNQYEYEQTLDVSACTLNLIEMSRDVLTIGSTMRIPLLYRGEYSQWVERFMNYLEEQIDEEAMINSIKNGDQPLPRVTQVSITGTTSTEQPPLKDKSMWSDQEKRVQKIDRLARSLLIQGLPNDIYSLIDSNKTAKDLWDALARHMLGSEYGEQDRKATVLYEYETFKA